MTNQNTERYGGKGKKYFPCWVCKGQGGYTDPVTDEGQGPYYPCDYCGDQGVIEIDGTLDTKIKRESIAIESITKFKPKKEEWTEKELINLGKQIEKLVRNYE